MKLNDYQRQAQATRNPNTDLVYVSGKLTAEAAELQQHVLKWRYHGKLLPAAAAIDELGDVLWYAAAVADELGVTLQEVAEHNLAKLQQRHGDTYRKDFYNPEHTARA
jgi:NTP pyrophosphatase (non-canonical NTP hydrolase)